MGAQLDVQQLGHENRGFVVHLFMQHTQAEKIKVLIGVAGVAGTQRISLLQQPQCVAQRGGQILTGALQIGQTDFPAGVMRDGA